MMNISKKNIWNGQDCTTGGKKNSKKSWTEIKTENESENEELTEEDFKKRINECIMKSTTKDLPSATLKELIPIYTIKTEQI